MSLWYKSRVGSLFLDSCPLILKSWLFNAFDMSNTHSASTVLTLANPLNVWLLRLLTIWLVLFRIWSVLFRICSLQNLICSLQNLICTLQKMICTDLRVRMWLIGPLLRIWLCMFWRPLESNVFWRPLESKTFDALYNRMFPKNPTRKSDAQDSHNQERWGAGVETQKNVRGEIGGWGRVPFNEPYAPSLSTIYDGA